MECIHFILDWNKMAMLMECSSSIVMPWVSGRREEWQWMGKGLRIYQKAMWERKMTIGLSGSYIIII